MANLCSGLNHYLQSPPNNDIINLMHNDCFQNAKKVFVGVLRTQKKMVLMSGSRKSQYQRQICKNYMITIWSLACREVTLKSCSIKFSLIWCISWDVEEKKAWESCKKNGSEFELMTPVQNMLKLQWKKQPQKIKATICPLRPRWCMITTSCLPNQVHLAVL